MSNFHIQTDYHDPDNEHKHQPDYLHNENQEMDNLSVRLQKSREETGLSQTELAVRAGCSQGLIGNLESGNQKTSSKLPAIAQVLCVEAFWLSEGRGPKKRGEKSFGTPSNESIPTRLQDSGIASRHIKVEAIADRLDTIADKLTSDDWATLNRLIALIEANTQRSETK